MNARPIYGIKHRRTGLFFVGFAGDHSRIWGTKAEAMRHVYPNDARCQAGLLRRTDPDVQIKPVVLGMTNVCSLMRATPTGDYVAVDPDALRPEFRYDHAAVTIDAPEWMPAGGCHNWTGRADVVYLQPRGVMRNHLEAA